MTTHVPKTNGPKKLNCESVQKNIAAKAPSWVSPTFANQVLAAVDMERAKSEKLSACDDLSVIESAAQCAQLGLIPSTITGHAYLVPYGKKCTLIIGYKGLITLLCRNKDIQSVHARIVREGDTFETEYGTDEKIVHIPNLKDRKPITHVYAIITYKSGLKQFEIMTKEEIDIIKTKSKSQYIWKDHYEAMALKTVIRRIAKYIPSNSMYEQLLEIETKQEEQNQPSPEQKVWEADYVEQNSDEALIAELEVQA